MKLFPTTVAALLLLAAGASAAAQWGGPGWYQLAHNVREFISTPHAGPFADERSCVAALPPDDGIVYYGCEYFETKDDL
jgi:hypothetical protein